MNNLTEQLNVLKEESKKLLNVSLDTKNLVLKKIAYNIEKYSDEIFKANRIDLEEAKDKVTKAVYSRLKLDEIKLKTMIDGLHDLSKLEDPVNKVLLARELDKNLNLYKVTCPIGVLAVIFEARPDVITQVTGLAIKSSNALVLKGGKEVLNTNRIIFDIIKTSLSEVDNYPQNTIMQLFSRDDISQLLEMDNYIDLIIPRGGNNLVKYIKENTKIPVLGHANGICNIYIDEFADCDMVKKIIFDAKTQYPSACNSIETILFNKNFKHITEVITFLKNNEIEVIETPDSWSIEYSEKKLSVKIIENIDEAILHINKYGSGHTDCIITDNKVQAEKFMNEVDSSGVYHNVSTRFADGYRYGFGAEVGISTNKIHARGPVGLEGLTIYKYKLYGKGQIVKDYVEGTKTFTHKNLI